MNGQYPIAANMKARGDLLKALQAAIPLDANDARLIDLAAAIEDMIDTKIECERR
jgi:hypothetical protein